MDLPEEIWVEHIRSFLLAPDIVVMNDAGLDHVRDWVGINERCAEYIADHCAIEESDEGLALGALVRFISINPSISAKPGCARFFGEVMAWGNAKRPLIKTVEGAESVECYNRCGFLVRGWRRRFHF